MALGHTLISHSVDDLGQIATDIIRIAAEEKIWLMIGEMGAGKTTTISAICKSLEVVDIVHRPTFSIVNEYLTKSGETIYHFDVYRIEDIEEVVNIGIEEYFDSGNLCLIEWPQNIEAILPNEFLRIDINENLDHSRNFKLTKHG